jgi:hypothetical protein
MRRALACGALLLSASCTTLDVVARERDLDGSALDGGADAAGSPAFCGGAGPSVLVSDSRAITCSGDAGEASFAFGVCACAGLAASDTLRVDAFERASGPYPGSLRSGGSLGVRGLFGSSAAVVVGGELRSVGGLDLGIGGDVTMERGALGAITGAGRLDVATDLRVAGSIEASFLRVSGTLTLPPSATIAIADSDIAATVRADVSIEPPCECGPSAISGAVARRALDNDDALVGLSPEALVAFTGPRDLALPCGRLYLRRIEGTGALTLVVTGRTALHVGGTLRADQLDVVLEGPVAELDLIVEAGLVVGGEVVLGDALRPGRARLFVESGPITLSRATFAGPVFAPGSRLDAASGLEVHGTLVVSQLESAGPLLVHHDVTPQRSTDACAPP